MHFDFLTERGGPADELIWRFPRVFYGEKGAADLGAARRRAGPSMAEQQITSFKSRKKGMSALSREVEIYSTVADVCYGQNQKFGRLLPNIGTMGPLDIRGSIKKINSRRGTLWRKLRK